MHVNISMFHGLVGNSSTWKDTLQILESSAKDFYIPDIDYKSHNLDEIILSFRSSPKLGVVFPNKSISVGNSLGCLISLGLADNVDKLILTAPPFKFNSSPLPRTDDAIKKLLYEILSPNYRARVSIEDSNKYVEAYKTVISNRSFIRQLRAIKKSISSPETLYLLEKNQEKIHFILGREDMITSTEDFLNFISLYCPKSKVSIIEECGHAVPIEKPEKLAKLIRSEI